MCRLPDVDNDAEEWYRESPKTGSAKG